MFPGVIKEYKELKWLAYHDSLTGLLNRNWLYKHANPISHKYVYFIDINDLHEINRCGHTFGDEFIKAVVGSIYLEEGDILIRYAGDEFILLSNRRDAVQTNALVAVGFAEITDDCLTAINRADGEMLKSKEQLRLLSR